MAVNLGMIFVTITALILSMLLLPHLLVGVTWSGGQFLSECSGAARIERIGSIGKILISDIRYRYTDIETLAQEAKCMSQHGWNRPRQFAWGIFAILAVIVASVAVSAFLFETRPAPLTGIYYPYFFPFPLFFIFGIFAFFWIVRWLVFPWRWGWCYRGYRGRYWRYQDESFYIIRERYARGEITKEQFDQMMRDLQQHDSNQL